MEGFTMSVNGITGTTPAYTDYSVKPAQAPANDPVSGTESANSTAASGVVYEKSAATAPAKANVKGNPAIAEQLKAATEARVNQMRDLVQKLISGQGDAYGKATDMWQFLASGNFTVDPATKAQAQADIAEDGYWGVNQTSDRILDFAKALSGGDPDKMNKMADAFKKGFEQATRTWGGKLPDISQRTYDKVLEKFDKWQEEYTQNAAANGITQ
ncbi:MAG: hypothetical protein E7294_15290 [Lachnospiraceae bacterium]|nr:hypothetical protein [Lachnospiraceae bacterium]